MKKSHLIGALCAVVFTVISMSSHAALVGRDLDGNLSTAEAYYDTVAGLTWLADANAAVGSAYDTYSPGSGLMDWYTAMAWAQSLSVGSVTSGWRLPVGIAELGGLTGESVMNDELTNLFINVLGAELYIDPRGELSGIVFYNGSTYQETPTANYDLFTNIIVSTTGPFIYRDGLIHCVDGCIKWIEPYWTSTEPPDYDPAVVIDTTQAVIAPYYGFGSAKTNLNYAWAVHDGDVGAAIVPVPAAVWLFGSGLLGLIGIARKKAALK